MIVKRRQRTVQVAASRLKRHAVWCFVLGHGFELYVPWRNVWVPLA